MTLGAGYSFETGGLDCLPRQASPNGMVRAVPPPRYAPNPPREPKVPLSPKPYARSSPGGRNSTRGCRHPGRHPPARGRHRCSPVCLAAVRFASNSLLMSLQEEKEMPRCSVPKPRSSSMAACMWPSTLSVSTLTARSCGRTSHEKSLAGLRIDGILYHARGRAGTM